jgi:hypothetical protein
MSDIDFETRVRNNGVKVKNVPNARTEGDKFLFGDYVAKNVSSWSYVPDVDSEEEGEEYAREVAEDMYEIYGRLAENVEEVELTKEEDEMYWADVVVDIPDDSSRAERVAEEVAEAILARQQL